MKTMFEAATADEVRARVGELTPESEKLWGKMSAAQMMEHCARSLEWAVGDSVPPKLALPLRVIGKAIKPLALGSDRPMRPNSPTAPDLLVRDSPDFDAGRVRLFTLIDRFVAGGAAGCTELPHSFFGKMTPDEWGVLVYKHMDHHLRQFGV